MIVPSLLEYSEHSLRKKLQKILNLKNNWRDLVHAYDDRITLHLDFVQTQFAKDNSVLKSLNLKTVLACLDKNLDSEKLVLSIHLMGTLEDLVDSYGFWQTYELHPDWAYEIYVPVKYFQTWTNSTFVKNSNSKISTGIWLDLNEWNADVLEDYTKICNKFLLMTVKAGKSGQLLRDDLKNMIFNIAGDHPKTSFLADGGWQINENISLNNLHIISYSSFWNSLL